MSSDSKHHVVGVGPYLAVIATLMVLTVVTVWAAFKDFGAMNNVVAMGIAAVKTMFVVTIFMHLKYAAKITWMFAGMGVVFFIIMITFLMGDYFGRHLQQWPAGWEQPAAVSAPAAQHH